MWEIPIEIEQTTALPKIEPSTWKTMRYLDTDRPTTISRANLTSDLKSPYERYCWLFPQGGRFHLYAKM